MNEKQAVKVFEDKKIENIEGNELDIRLATFIEGEKLFSETLKCYNKGLFEINLFQEEGFKEALLPCLKKAFWNKEPINGWAFFEKIENRQYYIEICLAVFEFNIKPFMSRLLLQSQRASQETDLNTPQK